MVQTSTSNSFSQKSTMTCLQGVLAHLAVRDADPGLRDQFADPLAARSIDSTRLWR